MSEINWGGYAVIGASAHQFKQMPEWFWKVKPVTSGMELEYAKFVSRERIVRNPDGSILERIPTWVEMMHRQIALCFAETNIPLGDTPVEEGGKPILEPNAKVEAVERILAIMPQEMVEEIWLAISEFYPAWGPPKRREDAPN